MTTTNSTSRSAYHKAWRATNREKQKAYDAAYYIANRDKMRAQMAAHYKANTDVYKERAAAWAKANPERRYEIADAWRKDHPEASAEWRRRDWIKNKTKRQAGNKEFRSNNPEVVRAINAAWHAKHPEANAHHVGLRRTRRMQATPAWADLTAIKALYKQAAKLRKQTGEAWHVDHVIPLKHPFVCGLHVHVNLQVIPAPVNQSKANRFAEGAV